MHLAAGVADVTSSRLFFLWVLVVGATFILGRRSGAADYVRNRWVRATKEQMEAIYFFIGAVICVLALIGLAASVLAGVATTG